ncbi:efflux transporter periplasmic adaptor subunit [Longibacter salinarum]|uniref:Efflux transporter periplasmic adaptor subunit n=1 Tax=Longibacter salinarum TaxID=1850348 RepID=A0A2A8CYY7_9BACT|nr:efflux RND transporter periplasmic adaptor subunit [Longibacter salinarum]PEN13813.1 efflux transporter periplasmic adaptor subunit [Longibacter salinarum]
MSTTSFSRTTAVLIAVALLVGVGLGVTAMTVFSDNSDVEATAGSPPASDSAASAASGATGLAAYDKDGDGTVYQGGMHPEVIQDEPGNCPICGMALTPTPVNGQAPEGTVQISPTTLQNIGVKTAPVRTESLARRVRTTGRFEVNERRTTAVAPKVGGWVDKLYVDYEGARVGTGQPLIELYSPELVATQEEYLSALRAAERLDDASSQRLVEAARRRLAYWDISDAQIERLKETREPMRTLTFYAPSAGTVTKKSITEGEKFSPGETLMQIANLSSLWLMADIYEQDLAWIDTGSKARVRLPYDPTAEVEAEVDYIYDEVDGQTRTVRARVSVPNPDRNLRPGMYAVVMIEGDETEPYPVVPQESIVDSGDRDIVILAEGNGRFRPVPVQTGRTADGKVQVVEGLRGNETVVTSAQFLIDSEARLQGALSAMTMPGHDHGSSDAMSNDREESRADHEPANHSASDHAEMSAEQMPSESHDMTGGQMTTRDTVDIRVTKSGFEPSMVHVKKGDQTVFRFIRQTESTCATNVQIPALDVKPTDLPMNEAVAIEVTPEKTGSFTFACGMDMIEGTVMVERASKG